MELRNIKISPNAINQSVYVSQGDIGSAIALQKFMEIRNLISFANIAIKRAQNENNLVVKFCLYRSAILDYNACYDYVLQIIYFGFDFCSTVLSKEDYYRQMKDECRWNKIKNKMYALQETNVIIKSFAKDFVNFRSSIQKSDISILEWANSIKHHGSFIAEELINKENVSRIFSINSNENIIFDTEFIFQTTTFHEIEKRLEKQNEIIVNYLVILHNNIFGEDASKIDLGASNKLFSANCYNKEELKGNSYLQSFINNN
jgi:hypothetical protein